MRILIFFLAVLGLQSCISRTLDTVVTNENTDTVKTTYGNDSISSTIVKEDKNDYYFNNPTRDMKNFSVNYDNPIIDSLKDLYNSDKDVQVITKHNLCDGDCCTSFKKMTNNKTKITLSIFKTDCGDYGFSNDEYIFSDENLLLVRNFALGIETWPTDTSQTIWYIEEKVLEFRKEQVTIRVRKSTTKDNTDFTLKGIPFKETNGERLKLTKEKTDEYNRLSTKENTEQ